MAKTLPSVIKMSRTGAHVGLLSAMLLSSLAYGDDAVSIDLTGVRIANALAQTRSSAPRTIDPAYKYFINMNDGTLVRGQSGLFAILYPSPVPLAELLETFSPGSSQSLQSAVLNVQGTHPFVAPPQTISGAANGATITLTLQVQIAATGVASFDISSVTLSPTFVGSLIFTAGSVNVSQGCLADFNEDGGVDGTDIESFFITWAAGDTRADVNDDGGIDGADVAAFFIRWQAGC